MDDAALDLPAADTGELDLSALPPATAAEIRRLDALMVDGDETPDEGFEALRFLGGTWDEDHEDA